jgi:hypothetical protein
MIPNANETRITAGKLASVRYVVVSQRWLTRDELKQFDDEFGLAIAVRMRLSNESAAPFYYLADGNGSIHPQGYEFFRKVGEIKWDYLPPTRGREGAPGTEPVSNQYKYLILPAGAAIEFEIFDWNRPVQEHAFSTFVKLDVNSRPIEIVSDTFRPLSIR